MESVGGAKNWNGKRYDLASTLYPGRWPHPTSLERCQHYYKESQLVFCKNLPDDTPNAERTVRAQVCKKLQDEVVSAQSKGPPFYLGTLAATALMWGAMRLSQQNSDRKVLAIPCGFCFNGISIKQVFCKKMLHLRLYPTLSVNFVLEYRMAPCSGVAKAGWMSACNWLSK